VPLVVLDTRRVREALKAPSSLGVDLLVLIAVAALAAALFAYADGTFKGGTDRSDGPVLPDGYATHAKEIAERRVGARRVSLGDGPQAGRGEVMPAAAPCVRLITQQAKREAVG